MPHTALIIVAVVVILVLAAVIAYFLTRFMRGSIKLSLPRTAFNPGETITGNFVLQTKKPIQGNRLIASLIGVQVTTTYSNNNEMQTRTREIYRDDVLVEDAKEYPAGHTATHDFKIVVPNTNAPEFMNSPLAQTLVTALSLLGNKRSELKWKVEARLDAKGVDLAASRAVSINMKQML